MHLHQLNLPAGATDPQRRHRKPTITRKRAPLQSNSGIIQASPPHEKSVSQEDLLDRTHPQHSEHFSYPSYVDERDTSVGLSRLYPSQGPRHLLRQDVPESTTHNKLSRMPEPQRLHTAISYAVGQCQGYEKWDVVTHVRDNACLTVHITPRKVSVSRHGTHIDTTMMTLGTKGNNLDPNSSVPVPAAPPRQYCMKDLLNPSSGDTR